VVRARAFPIGDPRSLVPLLSIAILAPFGAVWPQDSQTEVSTSGYEVERSQSVQNAPPGSVGRKTTDREHRVGNTDETRGHDVTYVLTLGTFMRGCPTADGIAEGEFEYTLTYDDVTVTEGERRQTHKARQLNATLRGHVDDDARLGQIDLDGTYATVDNDSGQAPRSTSKAVHTSFRLGASADPDIDSLKDAAAATGEVSVAVAAFSSVPVLIQAQASWAKVNECVEFTFDPPTDTRSLDPNESAQVQAVLRTKKGSAAVPWKTEHANALQGIGKVEPRHPSTEDGLSATLTYTASAKPRKGHGIDLTTASRAGVGSGQWRITDPLRYQGTFTQIGTMRSTPADFGTRAGDAARYAIGVSSTYTITGNLTWTRDPATRASTFGDEQSVFFVPTDGQIEIEVESEGHTLAGVCTQKGSKTFAIRDLPPGALQYLLLEVANDGRYRIWLGMVGSFLQFEVGSRCAIGGRSLKETLAVNDASIVLGQQGGVATGEALVGELAAPIVDGPFRYTGSWNFKKPAPPQ
jgi:hypothetical protein